MSNLKSCSWKSIYASRRKSVLNSVADQVSQKLADRLSLDLARQQVTEALEGRQDSEGKLSSMTTVALGASIGAGLGVVLAVVMSATSALRKP